jgi:hypothetical protein
LASQQPEWYKVIACTETRQVTALPYELAPAQRSTSMPDGTRSVLLGSQAQAACRRRVD